MLLLKFTKNISRNGRKSRKTTILKLFILMIFGKFKKGAGELNQKVYPASKKCEGAGVVKRAGLKIQ